MNISIIDYFRNNISYNYNISDYYNILVETITLFNNKSLELCNNINFDNKLVNVTVTFTIITLIQYAYIYYILGELSRLETRILNITEDMIKENIEKNIEKDNNNSNKRQCFGFNTKKTNNLLRRNPKRSTDNDNKNIARYGDSYLSKEEFLSFIKGVEKEDSVLRANNFINNWAIEKILIEKAELNLNEIQLKKINSLASEYRSSLLSEAYLEAIVNSSIKSEIDSIEIQTLYENNKSLFSLNDDIFKLVFIELPLDFSDTYQVRTKLKRYGRDDQNFLDSISYRYKNFSLTAKNWVTEKKLLEKFPFLTDYSVKSLKNYKFFQFKDSLSLYLIKILDYSKKGGISPIDNVLPTLEYMSLNKRKKELMLKIRSEILKDALHNNKLEIY